MAKTGRNDPCPCGSGKKYKKCCLPKEQLKSAATRRSSAGKRQDETDDLFEDLPTTPAENINRHLAVESDIEPRPELDEEPFLSNTVDHVLPDINQEEQAIVDGWWTVYKGLKDPDAIVRHLNGFFQSHPGLVVNLELHHDVLFSLGDKLIRAGRAHDYIDLLQRVRREFPSAYLKSFVYYDRDIIFYKVANRELDGIEDYLIWFKEYPDADADVLSTLINFLMVTECDQQLIPLLKANYYPVYRSEKVIGDGGIMAPLVLSYCTPYLERDWTRKDVDALAEQLKAIRVPLHRRLYRPDYLNSLFDEILGDLDSAYLSTYSDSPDIYAYYQAVTHNFMGWLHQEQGCSWMKAQFYQDHVLQYFFYAIPDGKRPKQPFVFSRQLLEDTISQMGRRLFSLDPTITLGTLNAIYWFVEFLLQHQAISRPMHTNVQRWCEEIWGILIPQFIEREVLAPAFDTFPQ